MQFYPKQTGGRLVPKMLSVMAGLLPCLQITTTTTIIIIIIIIITTTITPSHLDGSLLQPEPD